VVAGRPELDDLDPEPDLDFDDVLTGFLTGWAAHVKVANPNAIMHAKSRNIF